MTTLYSTKDLKNISVGDRYTTLSNGDFEVVEIIKVPRTPVVTRYKIKFLATGYELITTKVEIKRGKIKDRLRASVFGIGRIGNVRMVDYKREYTIWNGMLERCYNYTSKGKFEYDGVTVCDRWLTFSNFVEDYNSIARYGVLDESKLTLDKDFLQEDVPKNERVYSLETVILTSREFNSSLVNRGWEDFPIEAVRGAEVVVWDSWRDVSHSEFNNKKYVLRCLKGVQDSYLGFRFRYIKEE